MDTTTKHTIKKKSLLIATTTLTAAITTTTLPQSQLIPNYYHHHHHNPINTTTTPSLPTNKKLSIALLQKTHLPPLQQLSAQSQKFVEGLFVMVEYVYWLLVLVLS